jgi:hypothetical protein
LTQGGHFGLDTGGFPASDRLSRQLKAASFDNVAKSPDRRSSRRNFTVYALVDGVNLRRKRRK